MGNEDQMPDEFGEDMFDDIMGLGDDEENKGGPPDVCDFLANRDKLEKPVHSHFQPKTYDLKLVSSPMSKDVKAMQFDSPVCKDGNGKRFQQLEKKFAYVPSRARERSTDKRREEDSSD